jgi:ATP-dependent DNA ligase
MPAARTCMSTNKALPPDSSETSFVAIPPMLAKRVDSLPQEAGWLFEPKWDGFRVLVFRDGDHLFLQSRELKPLNRYFPELVQALLQQLPQQCILDGEIVIARANGSGVSALDFDALTLRIHPAASRVKTLSEQMPASVVFFDLLAAEGQDFRHEPLSLRRAALERLLHKVSAPLHLTPATQDMAAATDWFTRFEGAGLDGVMAKRLTGSYEPGKRTMLKVKHERDCDCVVAGFRWHKDGPGTLVGSLLLGLFNHAGALQHVGVCSSFTADRRAELAAFLAPYRENALANHPWASWAAAEADGQRMPGGKSRWTGSKDLSWVALRPELVVEVAYEHMQGDRFRHLAHFRRWRPDKSTQDCTYEQLEVVAPLELHEIFASAG